MDDHSLLWGFFATRSADGRKALRLRADPRPSAGRDESVEYPEGYFYVERTLALLFGLVAQLSPKLGLPGLVMPHASKMMMTGFGSAPLATLKRELGS
ncbi:MAG TPA: hypothetical protein VHW01_11300 [Polyangiaceae bacterium]|nr:hypothetical protein [Polyangiaceae bacterium]